MRDAEKYNLTELSLSAFAEIDSFVVDFFSNHEEEDWCLSLMEDYYVDGYYVWLSGYDESPVESDEEFDEVCAENEVAENLAVLWLVFRGHQQLNYWFKNESRSFRAKARKALDDFTAEKVRFCFGNFDNALKYMEKNGIKKIFTKKLLTK